MDQPTKKKVVIAAIGADDSEFDMLKSFMETLSARSKEFKSNAAVSYLSSLKHLSEEFNRFAEQIFGVPFNTLVVGIGAYKKLPKDLKGKFEIIVVTKEFNPELLDHDSGVKVIVLDRDISKLCDRVLREKFLKLVA